MTILQEMPQNLISQTKWDCFNIRWLAIFDSRKRYILLYLSLLFSSFLFSCKKEEPDPSTLIKGAWHWEKLEFRKYKDNVFNEEYIQTNFSPNEFYVFDHNNVFTEGTSSGITTRGTYNLLEGGTKVEIRLYPNPPGVFTIQKLTSNELILRYEDIIGMGDPRYDPWVLTGVSDQYFTR